MIQENLKARVSSFWNIQPCGTDTARSEKFSREYWEQIEEHRYRVEPEIFSFAQFTRFQGQKILEVGVGAGTDFLQWVRAGTLAHGIDLTAEGVAFVKKRLDCYGLSATEIKVADAEHIPYPSNYFDLVYSWGVIHHTPDTIKALEEIIRVTRTQGVIKVMVYNRHSLSAFYKWLYFGLLRGKPFRSIADILYHHQESIGTKGYTISEVRNILSKYPVTVKMIKASATSYDLLSNRNVIFRGIAYLLSCILGSNSCGWFLTIELEKTG
jgi:ubiquinone/menaquinone biosynthesis C-methylase UbiE